MTVFMPEPYKVRQMKMGEPFFPPLKHAEYQILNFNKKKRLLNP